MGFGLEPFSSPYLYGLPPPPSADTIRIDDLLDFSGNDDLFDNAAADASHHHHHHLLPNHEPPYYTTTTASNCSFLGDMDASGSHAAFADDLYVPSDEAVELEWLSNFMEDSASDVPYPSLASLGISNGSASASTTTTTNSNYNSTSSTSSRHLQHHNLQAESSTIPSRARSKRSRAPTTSVHLSATVWSSLRPPPTQALTSTSPSSSSSSSSAVETGGGVRKCTHCLSEKTPQWRMGPMGPKTLCNACGVRYKSGRLVPEYRPAASPTFLLTQHSNSHRKVMELRRQKEMLLRRHHHHHEHPASAAAAASAGDPFFSDFEVR